MAKSKTRLVADFMSKVQQDTTTGEAKHTDLDAVATTVNETITGSMYNSTEIDGMFDEIITEIETIATTTVV
jgi:hypothetical protein